MRRLYTIDQFAKLDERLQRDSETAISVAALGAPEFVDDKRVVRYTFSTPEVGRDSHTVAADAWLVANFLKNPVFLWAHDDKMPPIGRIIDIGTVNSKLKGDVEYAERDLNPFADTIYRMVKARYINAVSASWIPLEFSFARDKSRPEGLDFKKVDLLEISQVPIPALPSALAEARAAGIDTGPVREWAERLLDSAGMAVVQRSELEIIRRAATMSKTVRTQPKADDALKAKHARALRRAPKLPEFKRGLYDVAQLCSVLCSVGYCHDSSEYEAAIEEDGSPVPGMLGEALVKLGEALKAMAIEEINELLDAHDNDEADSELIRSLSEDDRKHIAGAKSPRVRAWRTGLAIARSGLSPTNEDHLESAQEHQERAQKHHKDMGAGHESVGENLGKAKDEHSRATSTLKDLGEHIRAARENPAESSDHLDKASKAHGDATKAIGAAADANQDANDSNDDATESHRCMGRCLKRAQQCVRSAVSGAKTTGGDDADTDKLKAEEAAKAEQARTVAVSRARRERQARAIQATAAVESEI